MSPRPTLKGKKELAKKPAVKSSPKSRPAEPPARRPAEPLPHRHPELVSGSPASDSLAHAKALVLSDGRIGAQNQSLGVMAALGHLNPEIITLHARLPHWCNWLPVEAVFGRTVLNDLPAAALIVGAGWQIGRVSQWLKRRARTAHRPVPFVVQLMRPPSPLTAYDVVAFPQHDALASEKLPANVVVTTGAPNRVSKALLAGEGSRWAARLQHCPLPRLAVLIGGASKHGPFNEADADTLLTNVLTWAETTGGSLLITTSRRTALPVRAFIAAKLAGQTAIAYHLWQPDDPTARDNPFLAYLASCTAALVTAESVSMVSETATAGKPVYLYGDAAKMPAKFRKFYAALTQQGRLAPWAGKLTLRIPREGLADAALVAGFIRAIWAKRSS